jgi:hypothetical protein
LTSEVQILLLRQIRFDAIPESRSRSLIHFILQRQEMFAIVLTPIEMVADYKSDVAGLAGNGCDINLIKVFDHHLLVPRKFYFYPKRRNFHPAGKSRLAFTHDSGFVLLHLGESSGLVSCHRRDWRTLAFYASKFAGHAISGRPNLSRG